MSAEIHLDLAALRLDRGQLSEAARAYRDAIRIAPDNPKAWCNLGHVLYLIGEPEAAAGACRRAIRLDPLCAIAHANLGAALMATGNPGEAAAAFGRAVDLDPEDPELIGNLASARHKAGDSAAALTLFAEAIARDPDRVLSHRNLGWALMTQGRWHEACERLLWGMTLQVAAHEHFAPGEAGRAAERLDPARCRTALLAAKAGLEAAGVRSFLTYGTLLGLQREGDFISHDTDIDLGIWPGADKPAIIDRLSTVGFAYTGREPAKTEINLPFRHENGVVVELYEHFEEGGRICSGVELAGARLLWAFSPFDLVSRAWLGTRFLVPDEAARYLTEGYGDWQTPNPHFDATFWAPNIVGGFPPIARAFAYLRTLDALRRREVAKATAHLSRILDLDPESPEIDALRNRLRLHSRGP